MKIMVTTAQTLSSSQTEVLEEYDRIQVLSLFMNTFKDKQFMFVYMLLQTLSVPTS